MIGVSMHSAGDARAVFHATCKRSSLTTTRRISEPPSVRPPPHAIAPRELAAMALPGPRATFVHAGGKKIVDVHIHEFRGLDLDTRKTAKLGYLTVEAPPRRTHTHAHLRCPTSVRQQRARTSALDINERAPRLFFTHLTREAVVSEYEAIRLSAWCWVARLRNELIREQPLVT